MHRDPRCSCEHTLADQLFGRPIGLARDARNALERNEITLADQLLGSVRALVRELQELLAGLVDPVGRHLSALYEYVLRRLRPECLSPSLLDEITADLCALSAAWAALVGAPSPEPAPAA